MRLSGSRAYTRPILVPKMPPGLVEVMEGLTKDVLKHNPTNVYEFCANHMQKLLEIRDGKCIKRSLTLEEKIYNAQEMVRQRAEYRWQTYLKQSPTDRSISTDDISRENFKTQPLLQNTLKAPVHHDKELAADFEVEISHDLFDKIETEDKISANMVKQIDTNVEVTNLNINTGEENTVPTYDISEAKNENAMKTEKENDSEYVSIRENDHSSSNKDPDIIIEIDNTLEIGDSEIEVENYAKDSLSELKNENQKVETNSGLESDNQNEEINIVLNNENQIEETKSGLKNDYQSEETLNYIISLKNEDHIEYTTDKVQIKNQSNETDGASEIEIQNKNVNNALETESVNKILRDEILIKENTQIINEIQAKINTVSNSAEFPLNVANIKPSDKEGNEKIDYQKFEESEQKFVSQKYQPNDVPSDKKYFESDVNNLQDFSNGEIIIYFAENSVQDLIKNETERNGQIEIDNSTTPLESDNITYSSKHEETDLSSSHKAISYENTGNLPKKYVEDDMKQPNMALKVNQENDQNNGTGCDKTNEKSSGKSMIFIDDPIIEKNDIIVSHDMANKTLLEKANSKSDGNVESNVVEKSTPTRDITLIKRSVSLQGDNVKDDSTGLRSYEATQDEVNDRSNMNLETAAITIQKVFRNFLFKSRAESTFDDTANDSANVSDEDSDNKELNVESEFSLTSSSLNKERRGLGINRMDTVLQTVNEEKSLSLSTDDSSTLSSAATIIQSHVRGFLVRNKLNSYRTVSSNSLVNSNQSLEADTDQLKNKTILNIHIVPESSHLSRDESIITSMDLSLDGSPPSSINLHPLGYDKSERRKQLKREDAIQSISPPSNNSGKLSEDSVKDVIINEIAMQHVADGNSITTDLQGDTDIESSETSTDSKRVVSVMKAHDFTEESSNSPNFSSVIDNKSLSKMSSDELDVVTPFVPLEGSSMVIENTSKLVHSGEFHDMVLPTKVSRSDSSVVRGE